MFQKSRANKIKAIAPLLALFLAMEGIGIAAPGAKARLVSLRPQIKQMTLGNRFATARLLIDGGFSDGATRDVTGQSAFVIENPKIATVNESGGVQAVSAGQTTLVSTVKIDGATQVCRTPVTVSEGNLSPGFLTDVMPILTKASCNSGACHGANAGRGGFHLSLLGYDPDGDYIAMTRFVGSRRINLAQPENSLLLRKATARMRHGGGPRFSADSVEYRTLRAWIANNAAEPKSTEPQVKSLAVTPGTRTLAVGLSQSYRVEATYSDGSRRDVTSRTLFSTGDGAILSVSNDGTAKVVGPGEGSVVIRYGGVFSTARLTAPFAPSLAVKPALLPIDRLINEKVANLGLPASPACSDSEFLRRASLDVTGRLPKSEEVRAFLNDADPAKRQKLADRLLASPDYVDFWTLIWGDLLRNSKNSLGEPGMKSFYKWIRGSVQENKPWDKFVSELLLAKGSAVENGAANFFRAGIEPESQAIQPPENLGEITAQLTLGVRLQCARCHNHPFEKWKQSQFYEQASFFSRLEAKDGKEKNEKIISLNEQSDVYHPRTGEKMRPTPLDGTPLPADFKGDRRQALVDWMVAPGNPFFAQAIVNRIWKRYMGRGIVEPVDDFRVTNPPTNAALMDYLVRDLRENRFDLKHLMRQILLSDAYQRSSKALPGNSQDNRYYSRFLVKRLSAEQLLDALNDVTGSKEKFEGYPEGTRATQLMDTSVASSFLDSFGRPLRQTTCECERSSETSVNQALNLMNGSSIQDKLTSETGRLATLIRKETPPAALIEEMYLSSLSRMPTNLERSKALAWFERNPNRRQAAEDLLWAILNSKEFIFNR